MVSHDGIGGVALTSLFVYCTFFLIFCARAFAAEILTQKSEKIDKNAEISIEFTEEKPSIEDDSAFFSAPLEQLFRNPVLVSGLASGADAINRSVESLMDTLFYGLLDHEFELKLSKYWFFGSKIQRDVFSAPNGSYVVVDRIQLGPDYRRELWRAHDIPVSLGINGSVELLEIYLRTDGLRLVEQQELATWRRWANNWFGLLPVMVSVLPPSFNQNELYDPIREVQGPLSLPLSSKEFYQMPVGSIRSYALTGGVNLPLEFASAASDSVGRDLQKSGGFKTSLPYTVFKRGEHRINVLRRSQDIAWVGVKDLDRTGHKISSLISNKTYIFTGALAASLQKAKWIFAGVPISLFPFNFEFEEAMSKITDQVYEYDLRNMLARDAYERAVKGDFVLSKQRHHERVHRKINTGVTFHFTRLQDRKESAIHNGSNIAVFRKERFRDRFAGEVEVTDADGRFYVLETQQDLSAKTWDIFVGEEEMKVRSIAELRVQKVASKATSDSEAQVDYVLETTHDPMNLTFSMAINDRFVTAEEYHEYIENLRFFTKMPLPEVPTLPLRDHKRIESMRRSAFFIEPHREAFNIHVTPQHLGGFGAQAVVSFPTAQLQQIVNTPEDLMWRSYARAYGVDPELWGTADIRRSLRQQAKWITAFFLYPLKLFHFSSPSVDVIQEAENGIRQLISIRDLNRPIDKLDAFYRLVDSDYPMRVTSALLDMADENKVSRSVHFTVQPKGSASKETKSQYGRLNNKVFHEGASIRSLGRYQLAQNKIAAFYLDQPRDVDDKPDVARILVTTRPVPESLRATPYSEGIERVDRRQHVFISFACLNISPAVPIKLFIRVEQAGKVKIGKLHLAEKVIELIPVDIATEKNQRSSVYEFYLTGPLSPISNFIFDESVQSGDQLLVTLAVSSDGNIWSKGRQMEFRFEHGILTKPE